MKRTERNKIFFIVLFLAWIVYQLFTQSFTLIDQQLSAADLLFLLLPAVFFGPHDQLFQFADSVSLREKRINIMFLLLFSIIYFQRFAALLFSL